MPERTLVQLLESSAEKWPEHVLMWEKREGRFQGTTYRETLAEVRKAAAGLIGLGIEKGDRIALLSEGRNSWVVAELAIVSVGAINVPLSVKLNEPEEIRFRLDHSGCRAAIASGSQLEKLRKVREKLPQLEHLICLDRVPEDLADHLNFDDLQDQGAQLLAQDPQLVSRRRDTISEGDPANICYTSGTTADPKGVVLTHRNYTANVEQATQLISIPEYHVSLLILPWDHSFAHTAGIYTVMMNGASFASVELGKTPRETLKNIPVNILETRPTFLLSVPALAQNFKKNIERGIQQKGPLTERLFQLALRNAIAYNGLGFDRGRGLQALRKPLVNLFDKLIFSKVRQAFGGRLEFFIGGGALLDIELQRFFYAIGIPMLQGYGLTEAAPVISANSMTRHKLGSSGSLLPGLDLRICDTDRNDLPKGQKGEIVIRGENVMAGYWNNVAASEEVLRDGWLFTGDIGHLDDDGFLYVLGREKSLLISSDGEKFSPEGIEEALVSHSPFIEQVMLYNNQSPYTIGLISLNLAAIHRWVRGEGQTIGQRDLPAALLTELQSQVDQFRNGGEVDNQFPSKWLPSSIAVLPAGFSEENHQLNSTLKMVRGRIASDYADRIERLFTPAGRQLHSAENLETVEAVLTRRNEQ